MRRAVPTTSTASARWARSSPRSRSAGHRSIVLAGLCAGAWIGLRAALDWTSTAWSPSTRSCIGSRATPWRRTSSPRRACVGGPRSAATSDWPPWVCGRCSTPPGAARPPRMVRCAGASPDAGPRRVRRRRRRSGVLCRTAPAEHGGGPVGAERCDATVAGIDHPMHRHWLRPPLVDVLASWLDTVFAPSPAAGAVSSNPFRGTARA